MAISSAATSRPPTDAPTAAALDAAEALLARAKEQVRALVAPGGRLDAERLERHQHAAHGLAWLATYVEALRQMHGWATRLAEAGRFGELEQLILEIAFAEYLARIEGGIPMSQGEIVRPRALGLDDDALDAFRAAPVRALTAVDGAVLRGRLAGLLDQDRQGDWALEDDTLEMIREQFGRFAGEQLVPFAHDWHLRDALIPLEVIEAVAGLGVFGLTVPDAFGGLGMGKVALCVVTEELSRGYIGVGSLGTRSEIAAELIQLGGTDAQKSYYLPRIASGAMLPTAVFTEPDHGSDLASLTTRAVRDGEVWRLTGAKTWITHAARADLMTVLCRTDPSQTGYRGLSILLAEKPRGSAAEPFPSAGLSGSEIPVLGYRGMKEYTLAFDGFEVPAGGLLGGVEGQGFKQLMATFESARIQTAARAVGVAHAQPSRPACATRASGASSASRFRPSRESPTSWSGWPWRS